MAGDPTKAGPRCTAKAKSTGQRCKRAPVPGATVCVKHGGAAPQVQAAAARNLQERAAEKAIAKLWDPNARPVTNAVAEMQRLGGSMRAALDVLGARVGSGDEPCEECGRADLDLGSPDAVAWIRVIRELRQLLEGMERLGIEERIVELESAQVRVMALAVGQVFDVLALDDKQRARATGVLMSALRGDVAGVAS